MRLGTGRTTARLIAVPDGRRQLADGLVVEASIVARLLRVRLLAIDASVVIAPAHVKRRSPAVVRGARSPAIGAALAAAQRTLDEGAASLAASRATGTHGGHAAASLGRPRGRSVTPAARRR